MAGLSLSSFTWYRGGARIEGGLLIAPIRQPELYRPAEHLSRLLDDIQRVRDEQTALAFANRWGSLGLRNDVFQNDVLEHGEVAAIAFAERLGLSYEEARRRFKETYGDPPGFEPGDRIDQVLRFAGWVRGVVRLKSLLALFEGSDPDIEAGCYEVKEWLSSEDDSELWWSTLNSYKSSDEEVLQKFGWGLCREHFAVKTVLDTERRIFSDSLFRAVWIGVRSLPPGEGEPEIYFDGLFRFIQFCLLVNGGTPEPRRCADPKCGALFFPTRKGQRYCPPPPGARRSRCENRHGVERRRQRWSSEKELSALVDLGKESGKEPGSSFPENG